MKYNHIAKAISAEYEDYKANHRAYIENGDEWRVKAYSTKTRAAQYDAGLLTLDELRRHEITNNIYRYAGSWYYLRNMRNVEQHKKYFSDADAFPAEYQNMIDEQKQVEEVSKKLLVIEYYPA